MSLSQGAQFNGVTVGVFRHHDRSNSRTMFIHIGRGAQIKSGLAEGDKVSMSLNGFVIWLRKAKDGTLLCSHNKYRISGNSTIWARFSCTQDFDRPVPAVACRYATGKGVIKIILPQQFHSARLPSSADASVPSDAQPAAAIPPSPAFSPRADAGQAVGSLPSLAAGVV